MNLENDETETLAKSNGYSIKDVAAGKTHMLVIMDNGEVLTAGMKVFNVLSPVSLESLESDVVQVITKYLKYCPH